MTPQTEIQLIAAVTAAACGLVGAFLVLRRTSLLSDAISHAILPGIVVAFFLTESLTSPWLLLGAAVTGVLTVALIEAIGSSRLVKQDAAIGLVFPALFSVGVILISRFASDVHLDADAVLLGDPTFSWIERFTVGGQDWGPASLWTMGVVLVLVVAFVTVCYKELKLSTFDPALAAALGFAPAALNYAYVSLVSVVAVGAFDVVGSILVVALMIAPPAAAWLLTDRLPTLLVLSALIGVASAVAGYWLARGLDVSIAGRDGRRGRAVVRARAGVRARARARGPGAPPGAAARGVRAADAVGAPAPPRGHARGGPRVPRGAPSGAPPLGAGLREPRRPRGRAERRRPPPGRPPGPHRVRPLRGAARDDGVVVALRRGEEAPEEVKNRPLGPMLGRCGRLSHSAARWRSSS